MAVWIDAIGNLIAAAAAIVAAVIAIKTLTQTKNEQKAGLDRRKKQATLDAYNVLQEQVFDKINLYKPSEIKEIAKDRGSTKYKEMSAYLARIEHFCVGLRQDIYDMETFYELAHGYFDDERGILYPRMSILIERKQEGAEKDYFENVHWTLEQMKNISKLQ